MSDTVFVLGAGFSANAEIPVQEKIMKNIPINLKKKDFFADIRKFYKNIFNVEKENEFATIPLEDVFTFFDRSITSGEDTNNFNMSNILKAQNGFKRLIAMTLKEKLRVFVKKSRLKEKREAYEQFFGELVSKRQKDQKKDFFSIVSLNWDTIPEYFLMKLLKDQQIDDVKIDYTCYDYDYHNKEHIPSIHLKMLDKFNIKLEKLHGSLNWGYCSSCGRLFVKFDIQRPPVLIEKKETKCTECEKTRLKRLIITPTLMKNLNNTHLKMIWHNTLIDLQEAKRIVFIGYSFPLADFEFRYILTKSIAGSKNVREKKIRVLLFPPDDYKDKNKSFAKKNWNKLIWKRDSEKERYKNFFGKLNLKFKYMDALDFMKNPKFIWDW